MCTHKRTHVACCNLKQTVLSFHLYLRESLSDLPLVHYQLSHLASPYVLLKTFTWAHVVVVAEVSSSVLLRKYRNSIWLLDEGVGYFLAVKRKDNTVYSLQAIVFLKWKYRNHLFSLKTYNLFKLRFWEWETGEDCKVFGLMLSIILIVIYNFMHFECVLTLLCAVWVITPGCFILDTNVIDKEKNYLARWGRSLAWWLPSLDNVVYSLGCMVIKSQILLKKCHLSIPA